MGKRGNFGVGTGGASILVIFVLLCLTTFATLSIVSANADYKLTQRSAEAVAEYYAADLRASEILAELDAACAEAPAQGTVAERVNDAIKGTPGVRTGTVMQLGGLKVWSYDEAEVPGVTVEEAGAGATLRYTVPVGDTRELRVVLNVAGEDKLTWSIAAWQTASTVEWEESSSIQLWDGGSGEFNLSALPEGLAGPPAGAAE